MTGISSGKTWSRIGPEVAPTASAASGVWTLQEASENLGAGVWPLPKEGLLFTYWYNESDAATVASTRTTGRAGATLNAAGTKLLVGADTMKGSTGVRAVAWLEFDIATGALTATNPSWYGTLPMYQIPGQRINYDSNGNYGVAFNTNRNSYYRLPSFSLFSSSLSNTWNMTVNWQSGWTDVSGSDGYINFDDNDRPLIWYTMENDASNPARPTANLGVFPDTYAGGTGAPTWAATLKPNGSLGAPYYNQFEADGGCLADSSENVYVHFNKAGDTGGSGYAVGFSKYNSSGTRQATIKYRTLNSDNGSSTNSGVVQIRPGFDEDGTHLYWAGKQAWNTPISQVSSRTKMSNLEMGDTGSGTGWWRELVFTGGDNTTNAFTNVNGAFLSDDNSLMYQSGDSPAGDGTTNKGIVTCRLASTGAVQWIYKIENTLADGTSEFMTVMGMDVRGDFLYLNCSHQMGLGFYQGFTLKLKADGSTTGTSDFTVRNAANDGTVACKMIITKLTSGYTDTNVQVSNAPDNNAYKINEVPVTTSYATFGTTLIGTSAVPGTNSTDSLTNTGNTPGTATVAV